MGAMATAASFAKPTTSQKPNVILIYADDLGIGLLGCYGQKRIKTPHIDRLAAEGMKFTNYYGGVLCAPARWTLLTGMHDGRMGGWGHNKAGKLIELDQEGASEATYQREFAKHVAETAPPIAKNEIFLAQVAKQAGYQTAQFGKLDSGFLTSHERVKRFGWDFYEGFLSHTRCHGFYPPYIWRNGEKIPLEGNTDPTCAKMSEKGDEPVGSGGKTYSQNVFLEGILNYLRKNKEKPFFLYHPTQLPHGPVAIPELHPDFAEDETLSLAEKKYGSMVKMLDDHVGLIMAELKTLGIDDQTLVLFASDNGHEMYYGPKPSYKKQKNLAGEKCNLTDKKWRTSECGDVFDGAGGLAGMKRSGYQGGMLCPLIARWPNRIQPDTQTDLLTTHYDFMATLAELGGIPTPKGKDSLSYLPTLLGKPQRQTHDHIVINNQFRRMGKTALITREGWKIIEIDRKKELFQLYNIKTDPEECHNLEAQHPEKLQILKTLLLKELDSPRPDLEA